MDDFVQIKSVYNVCCSKNVRKNNENRYLHVHGYIIRMVSNDKRVTVIYC